MQADVTWCKISADKCGQATSDEMYASYVNSVAGLHEGTCAARATSPLPASRT